MKLLLFAGSGEVWHLERRADGMAPCLRPAVFAALWLGIQRLLQDLRRAGKGHSWPGSSMPARITSQDVDATAVMWAFFQAHPRP
jgi:hypothetical protein